MVKNNLRSRNLVICTALLLLGVVLTLFYIFSYNLSFSVISQSHSKDQVHNFTDDRIKRGSKISGEFVSEENHLGIISIGFNTFEQVEYDEEDTLVFRLKEQGQEGWYYENLYRSGLLHDVPFFPFGFPPIRDSENKTYIFELESLNGNEVNAVALRTWEPVFVSRYQIPRDQLTRDAGGLILFLSEKIFSALSNREVLFFSTIYFLPFIIYVIAFVLPSKKFVLPYLNKMTARAQLVSGKISIFGYKPNPIKIIGKVLGNYLHYFLLVLVFMNIFVIPTLNDIAIGIIGVLWLLILKKYKLEFRETFIVGIGLVILSPLLLMLQKPDLAEKAAVWAYAFMIVGAIQIIIYLQERGGTS